MATYYNAVPPSGYDRYGYSTSTSTSPAPEEYDYYHPNPYMRSSPAGTAHSKRHVRTTSYTPPRVSVWQSTSPLGGQPQYYTAAPRYSSPASSAAATKPDVSAFSTRTRRASTSGRGIDFVEIGLDGRTKRRNSVRLPTRRIFVDSSDDACNDDCWNQPIYQNVRPRNIGKTTKQAPTDTRRPQTSDVDTPTRSRARRASTSSSRPKPVPLPEKPSREPAVATAADAARHQIPAGYVLKNWDPSERPILLLGSVFDANSLGKWIYDWTVYTHHAGSPLAEMAGELWLMLIKFSHKMKRAEEGAARVKGRDNRELLADFQESGDRLWRRLVNLLKVCEDFMWRVAKRAGTGKAQMGAKSGVEFVKTIFGRDRELEETERIMSSIRLWLMRFDANCEELLRSKKSRG